MAKFTITIEVFADNFLTGEHLCRGIVAAAHEVHDKFVDKFTGPEWELYDGFGNATMLTQHKFHQPTLLSESIRRIRRLFA